MRRAAPALLALLLAACGRKPPPALTPSPTSTSSAAIFSDPVEYRDRPVSREAGQAYFGETGLGDPYGTGIPYPVLLAMMRAYPSELGSSWAELARHFGMIPRDGGDAFAPPVGFHLTTDPITHVAFVMMNCEVCHAERLRTPRGEELVAGLGSRRVRIHAYEGALLRIALDPGFTEERIERFADAEAREHGLAWAPSVRGALVAATIRNLRERARTRGAAVTRFERGLPGRVATIESFILALGSARGHALALPETIGWAKIPDVQSFRYRDTLSFDGVGSGAPTALVVEADIAAGARPEWFDTHRHIGTSLYLYLRTFERRLPFPGPIDADRARRGHDLFVEHCSGCHGRYEAGGAVAYHEKVVPLEVVGTDPARAEAVTPEFVAAANAVPVARGLTRVAATGGYVPPPLRDIWARAPFGHAGQWPTLRVLATPPGQRPRRYAVEPTAEYDLDAVGVQTHEGGARGLDEYAYDGEAPGFDVGGHPFLANLGANDAAAVIEYLKGL